MAQREANKPRRTPGRAAAGNNHSETGVAVLEERATALERERDQLKAELAAARAEIARLEGQRKDVANRIDWLIDSLHNIVEGDR